MKNKLYKLGAYAFVIALGILVFWPVNHWRLYDAYARPLALTQAESYCSGAAVGEAGIQEVAPIKPGCQEASGMDNTTPSITNAPRWACEGLDSTFPSAFASVDDCVGAVEHYQVWFLLDGGYTIYWDERHPRPTETVINSEDTRGESRGDFEGTETTTTTTVEEEETQ